MTTMLFLLGLALLILLIIDIHMTVFVPRGGAGLVTRVFYRGGWAVWMGMAKAIGKNGPHRRLLARFGPLLVPLTVLIWGVMLIAAFTLMYTPWIDGFSLPPAATVPMGEWAMMIYYSGYAAVTLGIGDVTPSGTWPRMLAVAQAGLGFATFTAAISYLLPLYSARNEAVTFSLVVRHLTSRAGASEPVDLLLETVSTDSTDDLTDWLEQISVQLAGLVELVGQYPQLQYFHEHRNNRALAIALRDLLELTTLMRSTLDPDTYPMLANGLNTRTAHQLGVAFLQESEENGDEDDSVREARRTRYKVLRSRLVDGGVVVRADEEAWDRFEAMSREWDVQHASMRQTLGYPERSNMH